MAARAETPAVSIEHYNSYVLRHWRRNLALHVADGALYTIGIALAQPDTILPGFIRDTVGAAGLARYTNRIVGLLPLVMAACFMMPQLLTAKLAEGRRLIKRPLLVLAFLERLPWLFMGIMTAAVAPGHPRLAIYLFLALIFAYQFNIGLVYPIWQETVAKTIPVRRRGLLFGVREGIGGLLGFAVLLSVRPLVSGLSYPSDYAVLFSATFAFFLISFAPLLLLREAPAPLERAAKPMGRHFADLWAVVRSDTALLRYLLCRCVYGLVQIAAPVFFAMRAVEVLEQSAAAQLALKLAMVAMLARSVVSVFIGPLGDRFGYRLMLSLAGVAMAAGIATALAADTAWGFYAAYTLATFAHMAFWLGHGNYVLELAPTEKRPSYISIDNMAGLPFVVVPFAGGWLADKLGYPVPFAAGIFLALAAAVLFMTVAPDPRRAMRKDLVA